MGWRECRTAEAGKEGFFKKENRIKHAATTTTHLSQDTLTRNLYVRVLAASPREPQAGDDPDILQWEKQQAWPPTPRTLLGWEKGPAIDVRAVAW